MANRASLGVKLYAAFGLAVLLCFGAACASAWDFGATGSDTRAMPTGARQPQGGFRVAPIFWHGGLGGGK